MQPLPLSFIAFASYVTFSTYMNFRKLAMKILEIQDPDFYVWETHIFFDDAMEPDDKGINFQVNIDISKLVKCKPTNAFTYPNVFTGQSICKIVGEDNGRTREKMVWC